MRGNGMSYDYLSEIGSLELKNKSVLIVGAGNIVTHYAESLSCMGIKDVTILSKSKESANKIATKFGFNPISGGYEEKMAQMKVMDLVIIATPIHLLLPATKTALKSDQTNILIEKPASLYHKELLDFHNKITHQTVRVAYNRLCYPNFALLKQLIKKDGGVTSCRFTFTEWIDSINFKNNLPDAYKRWGISNSLHVISMAFELIGVPKKLSSLQFGKLDWHPTGSIFVGSGMTKNDIPFSYHADWLSSGRWGIEIMTKENAYRLTPLEELHVCKKNSIEWTKMPFKTAFPNAKQGISEEIALMLGNEKKNNNLVSLEKAAEFIKIAEQIFGYV